MRKNNALSIYEEIGDMFTDLFPTRNDSMRSDIKETKDAYLIDVEMPGFKKEDVKISFDDGYLTIEAKKNEEKSEDTKYICKERRTKMLSRSFYVGDISESDIKAKMDNGLLNITVQKPKEKVPEKPQILIE